MQHLTARRIGWALMALALLIGWAGRGAVPHYGPFPAVVLAMIVGGIGVMLVVTDIMVRGMVAQVGKVKDEGESP